MTDQTTRIGLILAIGFLTGAVVYHTVLVLTGRTIIDSEFVAEQNRLINALEVDNQRLSDDLLFERRSSDGRLQSTEMPYSIDADARADIAKGSQTAAQERKFLMVTFGANWCVDCRTLDKTLKNEQVSAYAESRFVFVNVNVGEFNKNIDVAAELGVNLGRGIPAAVFYDPSGELIGATNSGELEPARLYSSSQILRFMRDVAERSRIRAPNSVL